ncbi:MAG: chorismate synthase [Actinobacteria bacterium]|nr:chorismate synthase [Actinomycetota bacterium]
MLRFLTAGESHGPGLVTIVEGLPKGIEIDAEHFAAELERRRQGHGRGARMSIEQDQLEIVGGIRHGRTLGSPVAVVVRNTEWPRWQEIMGVEPGEAGKPVTRPRPGHADLAGMVKYGTDDARDILERASARETAARTIAGTLAKRMLSYLGMEVISHVVAIGEVTSQGPMPQPGDQETIDASPVRCLDPEASAAMVEAIDRAKEDQDTLGGVFEVIAHGVPFGLGSHVHHDRRLDGLLAGALMSVPGVKAVGIGDGFELASLPGSKAHDEIYPGEGAPRRESNRSGGLEGGMSTGEPIRARVAMKPLSTLMRPLATVDIESGEPAQAVRERSDVCAVPAAAVVGEQMMAWVLASETQRKFGGDTVAELTGSFDAFIRAVADRFGR